jgi:hypothetical protein
MGIRGLWDVKSVDCFGDMGLEGRGRGFEEVNSLISLPWGNQVIQLGIEN